MANHGGVKKTKIKMTPELIDAMLKDLNERVFKGLLTIEYADCRGKEDTCWGTHVWTLEIQDYSTMRHCWLDGSSGRKFEIRHGGGDLDWWIDTVVTNEVAVRFDGIIWDDGVEEKWAGVPNKYDSLREYQDRKWKSLKRPLMAKLLSEIMSCFPEELR